MRRRVVTAVSERAGAWDRQLRSELRITNVPVPELRAEADDLARQYRLLDVRIQEANWAIDLAE